MTDEVVANPVIETARAKQAADNRTEYEIDGVPVKIRAVPAALIDEVTRRIKSPDVPMVDLGEEYGHRLEANPSDPAYMRALADTDRERSAAMIDACVMFGIDVPNGIPDKSTWLPKLKYMEKRGLLNLEGYDLKDPLEMEFIYKRFALVPIWLIVRVQELSAVTPQEFAAAKGTF